MFNDKGKKTRNWSKVFLRRTSKESIKIKDMWIVYTIKGSHRGRNFFQDSFIFWK